MTSAKGRILFFLALLFSLPAFGQELAPVDFWTKIAPSIPSGTNRVAFAHGKFYSASGDGGLYTSVDGKSWIKLPELPAFWQPVGYTMFELNGDILVPFRGSRDLCWIRANGTFELVKDARPTADRIIYSAVFTDGKYVLFDSMSVLISTNGFDWTTHPAPAGIRMLAAGAGQIVAVGPTNYISTNALDWEQTGTGRFFMGVTFGEGLFVAVGGELRTSTDGRNWQHQSIGSAAALWTVTHGPGRFVAAGNGIILSSNDGLNWSRTNVQDVLQFSAYGNGRFVMFGNSLGSRSVDGINWELLRPEVSGDLFYLTEVGGQYVISGVPPWITPDLRTFEFIATYPRPDGPIAIGPNELMSIGGKRVIRSTNGKTWQQLVSREVTAIAYGDAGFVAVGPGGTFQRQVDGTRVVGATAATNDLHSIAFGSGRYVAGGSNGVIQTSVDGTEWQVSVDAFTDSICRISFAGGIFIATGENGLLITSTDGVSWTRRQTSTTNTLMQTAYGHGRWVCVGFVPFMLGAGMVPQECIVLTSEDGVNWRQTATRPEQALYGITAVEDGFVAVGRSGAVYKSGIVGPPSFERVQATGEIVEFTLNAEVGKMYRMETRATLAGDIWETIGEVRITNATQAVEFTRPVGATAFYRLVQD